MTIHIDQINMMICAAHCSLCHARLIQHRRDNDGWCCQCYVEAGNPPADWHQGCMETYRRISNQTLNRKEQS